MTPGFDPSAKGWSLVNAKGCAAAAKLAYDESDFSDTWTDTHVIVRDAGNATVIGFRGTASIRNWITDCRFVWASGPECIGSVRLHKGFVNALLPVFEAVQAAAEKFNQPIILTGHSLGGALAMLCAWKLVKRGIAVNSVYTFGQPRVGNAAWRDDYNARLVPAGSSSGPHIDPAPSPARTLRDITWRVVNRDDVVALSPAVILGYRHAGQEAFLDELGHLDLNLPVFLKLADLLYGNYRWVTEARHPDWVDDHFMVDYLKDLAALPNV